MITLLLLVCATYMYGVVLHAHPVRGESHNQRNTTGEVATGELLYFILRFLMRSWISYASVGARNNAFFEFICLIKYL